MKEALYNLADEEFIFFIDQIGAELRKRKISHVFVGGAAVQSHIASRLCKKYDKSLDSLDEALRVQDFLRSTDDVDISLKLPKGIDDTSTAKQIQEIVSSLRGEYISGTENHILEYRVSRMGVKRPVFSVSKDDNPQERISMNFSWKPEDIYFLESKYFNRIINTSEIVRVPFSNTYSVDISVPKPEYVLATKISHFRAKDAMDIKNLVFVLQNNGDEIDFAKIRTVLGPNFVGNYDKFESLVSTNSK